MTLDANEMAMLGAILRNNEQMLERLHSLGIELDGLHAKLRWKAAVLRHEEMRRRLRNTVRFVRPRTKMWDPVEGPRLARLTGRCPKRRS